MPQQIRLLSKAEIVQRLRNLSKYHGLTVKALAAACGRSRETIYQARYGLISVDLQLLLSNALQQCQGYVRFRHPVQTVANHGTWGIYLGENP